MSCTEVCPVCVILVNKANKDVGCDGHCKRWFHVHCVKLSNGDYTKLVRDESLKWNCGRDDCNNLAKQPYNVLINQLISKYILKY